MAVTFIFGKPGGGKSYYAMRLLADELRHTQRAIVTNLPVDLGALNEYMQREHPNIDARVIQRVRIVEEEQVREWWRYRRHPDGLDLDLPAPDHQGRTPFNDSLPTFYILDEVHIQFNARQWQNTGPGALFYLSQHRKLGDDVVLISQTPGQVDKQLRNLTQDWLAIRNLGKERFSSWIRLPSRIVWRQFPVQPTTGMEMAQASGMFAIDPHGLGACYSTAAGVGIAARSAADTNNRPRGLPFWSLVIPALLLIAGLTQLPRLMRGTASAILPGSPTATNPPTSPPTPTNHPAGPVWRPAAPPPPATPTPTLQPSPPPAEPPRITAHARIGKRDLVWLDDGSMRDPSTGLEYVGPGFAIIRGTIHKFVSTLNPSPPTLSAAHVD